jgi:hypothetical protein
MKRYQLPIALALLLGILVGAVSAQGEVFTQILGFIANGQTTATITVLDTGDNSFIDAAVAPTGCTFLSYIDRDNGNKLLIKQDAGTRLIDVPMPPGIQSKADAIGRAIADTLPGFAAPGEKQADGSLVIRGNVLSIYFTGRLSGDETGKFQLQRLDMPLPACQT